MSDTQEQTIQSCECDDAKTLGQKLKLSKRTIFRLNSCAKIPKPVRIGGSVRWISAEISAWIMASCPDRDTWEVMKAAAGSSGNLKEEIGLLLWQLQRPLTYRQHKKGWRLFEVLLSAMYGEGSV